MRVRGGYTTKQRRKAIIKQASGFWGNRHISYRNANQSLIRAAQYAYRDRKQRKRDFRSLWIQRINAAVRPLGINYSLFINLLKQQNITLNRKMLSEWAIHDIESFKIFVNKIVNK